VRADIVHHHINGLAKLDFIWGANKRVIFRSAHRQQSVHHAGDVARAIARMLTAVVVKPVAGEKLSPPAASSGHDTNAATSAIFSFIAKAHRAGVS
jgi:hypothetical protein